MQQQKEHNGRQPMSIIGDKIHTETIKKELKTFRLHQEYFLTPHAMKSIVLSEKPNQSKPIVLVEQEKQIPRVHRQTTNHQYGTDDRVLLRPYFYHPKTVTEITKMYGSL
jgi:hypothetical protein